MRRIARLGWILLTIATTAAAADDPPRPPSLKTIAVPEPPNLDAFVRDRAAAVVLGKALFWGMQVGSDGVQACATCHFRAGTDPRSRNALNPGERRVTAGGERLFVIPDMDGFRVGDVNVRRVEPRNAPTVINAVFNHRNFWDGRASHVFNGVNHLGDDDPGARVYRAEPDGRIAPVRVRLEDASLASQAIVPIVSDSEMAAAGRTMADIAALLTHGKTTAGARVALLRPLAGQRVHPDDGVLRPWSRWPAPGLRVPHTHS